MPPTPFRPAIFFTGSAGLRACTTWCLRPVRKSLSADLGSRPQYTEVGNQGDESTFTTKNTKSVFVIQAFLSNTNFSAFTIPVSG